MIPHGFPACHSSFNGETAPLVTVEVPDVSRFRQKELLGSGGFADVYRQPLMGMKISFQRPGHM